MSHAGPPHRCKNLVHSLLVERVTSRHSFASFFVQMRACRDDSSKNRAPSHLPSQGQQYRVLVPPIEWTSRREDAGDHIHLFFVMLLLVARIEAMNVRILFHRDDYCIRMARDVKFLTNWHCTSSVH